MRGGVFRALLEDADVQALLGDAAMARAMVEVEIALARVEAELGLIPAEAAAQIEAALQDYQPDREALAAGTERAGVPVPTLVRELRQVVGEPAASALHLGATSQDIVDTALVLQLRQVLRLLEQRLARLTAALVALIEAHPTTTLAARTRSQQAVPTTFALKAAGWLALLVRHRERLAELRPRLLAVQFGGAAGNLAASGDQGVRIMDALAGALDLTRPAMPWHNQRDALAELGAWLALVTGSLGKFGQDVLLLAQSEVAEVREAAGGGSSTMPQKANPVLAEALVALARRNATLVGGVFEAMVHAHERDGSAWQLEWTLLPDMASTTAATLAHAGRLAETLIVDATRMQANLEASHGLLLAEAASFALAAHMPRAEAQALVKQACRTALDRRRDLFDILPEMTAAAIDWPRLRAEAMRPPGAAQLVARVLQAVAKHEGEAG